MRVSYIEPVVRLDPDLFEDRTFRSPSGPSNAEIEEARAFEAMVTFEDGSQFLACPLCSQPAMFMIPEGLRCDEHAWQAAARLDWDEADPWVPIRIDRSSA